MAQAVTAEQIRFLSNSPKRMAAAWCTPRLAASAIPTGGAGFDHGGSFYQPFPDRWRHRRQPCRDRGNPWPRCHLPGLRHRGRGPGACASRNHSPRRGGSLVRHRHEAGGDRHRTTKNCRCGGWCAATGTDPSGARRSGSGPRPSPRPCSPARSPRRDRPAGVVAVHLSREDAGPGGSRECRARLRPPPTSPPASSPRTTCVANHDILRPRLSCRSAPRPVWRNRGRWRTIRPAMRFQGRTARMATLGPGSRSAARARRATGIAFRMFPWPCKPGATAAFFRGGLASGRPCFGAA